MRKAGQSITQLLSARTVILASQSKGRQQLLQKAGIEFSVEVSNVDEDAYKQHIPHDAEKLTLVLAIEKAKTVANHKQQGLIIAADTIIQVKHHGKLRMVGKADDESHAKAILSLLSGKTHQVITGVAVIDIDNNKMESGVASTDVHFRTLSDQAIEDYLAANDWQGKAGAYGIQGDSAKMLISHIEGDESNVIGLPLGLLGELVARMH